MRGSTAIVLPRHLAAACGEVPERRAWLERLPALIQELQRRWSLTLGAPFEGAEVSCAWVAPAVRADGTAAVLKLAMPHFEGEHEIQGLRFWDGDPHWCAETLSQAASWPDEGLVREGLRLFHELSLDAPAEVLLATDLHAGNVLAAQREPWLVIDPKPFVGDPAYDATQHLLNCRERLLRDPDATIRCFADLLELDAERVSRWTFARTAAEPREDWRGEAVELARSLAP